MVRELAKSKSFKEVTFESNVREDSQELVQLVRSKRYDLIVTGDVLYYFDGGNFESSRVDEEIRILHIRGNRIETIWHATAIEESPAGKTRDFFIFKIKKSAGEFILSRELKDLGATHDTHAVLVGTYAVTSDSLFVSSRIVRTENNIIIAGFDYQLDLNTIIRSMIE